MTFTPEELNAHQAAFDLWYSELETKIPPDPHASDCAHWVGEPCDCVLGKRLREEN